MQAKDRIKLTLEELLAKYPVDELSIKMLCAEADISKQTLYNNYYGILEVIRELFTDYVKSSVDGFQSNHYWMDGVQRILETLAARKAVVMHVYNSKYRYEMLRAMGNTVAPILEEGIKEVGARLDGVEFDPEAVELLKELYMDIFMGITSRYIADGMTRDPQQIARVYDLLMDKHTANALVMISNKE